MLAVDEFIEAETSKMNWFDKAGNNYPKVETTKSLAFSLEGKRFENEMVIKPSLIDKSLSIFFVCGFCLFAFILIVLALSGILPGFMPLIGVFFIAVMIFYVIRNTFYNPDYIYEIRFTKEGINIKSKNLKWNEVGETCVMSKWEGKNLNSYLLIFKKDKSVDKHDLFKFGISKEKLAKLIEYYKTSTNASK